ncbi:MAG: hypothetical protein H0X36_00645 [Sphingomonadaceae bacterium]|nr:hypothetical protein [Sphingomonadaceae bacterium]
MKDQADLLVARAEGRAQRSRAKLLSTLAEIRHRLNPRVVATEAAESVADRAGRLVHDAGEAAKDRPVTAGAGAFALAAAVGLGVWMKLRPHDEET